MFFCLSFFDNINWGINKPLNSLSWPGLYRIKKKKKTFSIQVHWAVEEGGRPETTLSIFSLKNYMRKSRQSSRRVELHTWVASSYSPCPSPHRANPEQPTRQPRTACYTSPSSQGLSISFNLAVRDLVVVVILCLVAVGLDWRKRMI